MLFNKMLETAAILNTKWSQFPKNVQSFSLGQVITKLTMPILLTLATYIVCMEAYQTGELKSCFL